MRKKLKVVSVRLSEEDIKLVRMRGKQARPKMTFSEVIRAAIVAY